MAATAVSGLERKNRDLMKRNIEKLKQDQRKREESGNAEITSACKDAGSYLHHRGRGRTFVFV